MAVTLSDEQAKALASALSQPNASPEPPQWIAQHWLSLVALVLTSAFAVYAFHMSEDDGIKIWNKIFCVALFWILATVFELFYNGVHFNQNEKISSDPRALSAYLGSVLIGTALIVALS